MKVLVVDPRAERYERGLREAFPALDVTGATSFPEGSLAETNVLVTMGVPLPGIHFTSELAARMPALEWVQCLLSGPEIVLAALAERDDVLLTTAAGVHGPQMAEMALVHMLVLNRDLRRILRNQDARTWERVPQRVLEGKVAGILGMGAVGTHLAAVLAGLGMRVHSFSRQPRPVPGVEEAFLRDELAHDAPNLDFLVVLLPSGPDTAHFVDAAVLASLKETAYVIVLGRGGVVDEEALAGALSSGSIAGAGLDVFETEPLPADSPLWALDNAIVTPHAGGTSDRYPEQALALVVPNLRAFLDGRHDDMVNVVRR